MSKHTPGPWIITRLEDTAQGARRAEIEQDGAHFGSGNYRGEIAEMQSAEHIGGIGREELEANAALISAAPDLLEALENLLGLCAYCGDFRNGVEWNGVDEGEMKSRPFFDDAKAAIAKAKGGQR